MRYSVIVSFILAMSLVSGCATSQSLVIDGERYESSELKSVGAVSSSDGHRIYGYQSEYFKNGRLKAEQWSDGGGPLVRLEFHKNGMLKSEERYWNNQVSYGAYYGPDGRLEKTQGQRYAPDSQR